MDRVKGVVKGGWHPSGDRQIHRDTWKSDLKNAATGKKKDPYAYARDHTSAPLSSLKDPDSFGPPPRHRDKDTYPSRGPTAATSSSPSAVSRRPTIPQPTGGWGSAVPSANRRREEQEQEQEQEPEVAKPPEPYRMNTTGLRTDNLPKPPARRADNLDTASPPPQPPRPGQSANPSLPPRHQAPRQTPMPTLPPRMNDHPDEHTPPPPPSYQDAAKLASNPALINAAAATRLGQAGVAVPGFGIGSSTSPAAQENSSAAVGRPSQLSELQQRFSKLNTGAKQPVTASVTPTSLTSAASAVAAAAQKKAPPPRPPKKASLTDQSQQYSADVPPPLPLGSKPKPF